MWIGIAAGLDLVVEVAIWTSDPARAVLLGAAAQRLKDELGGGVPPAAGGAVAPLVVARDQLTRGELDREVDVGRTMDLDAAIAEALATRPPAKTRASGVP